MVATNASFEVGCTTEVIKRMAQKCLCVGDRLATKQRANNVNFEVACTREKDRERNTEQYGKLMGGCYDLCQ